MHLLQISCQLIHLLEVLKELRWKAHRKHKGLHALRLWENSFHKILLIWIYTYGKIHSGFFFPSWHYCWTAFMAQDAETVCQLFCCSTDCDFCFLCSWQNLCYVLHSPLELQKQRSLKDKCVFERIVWVFNFTVY